MRYVELYKDCAISEMKSSGIPASITLAQGILESDCGDSELAREANNHFGIKCHDWTGERAYHDDDKDGECFRKYSTAAESFADHSYFLTSKQRYADLFKLDRTDYVGWANGLKKAGYATDPNYAKRLIDIIEDLGLHKYDTGEDTRIVIAARDTTKTNASTETVQDNQPKKPTVRRDASFTIDLQRRHEIQYNNGVRYVETSAGDSFEGIAEEFHLLTSELLHYNDLESTSDKLPRYVYLRSKRNRAHPDCSFHTVQRGDTPWNVAHKYGIKLKKLCKYNSIGKDETLSVGSQLNLRTSK